MPAKTQSKKFKVAVGRAHLRGTDGRRRVYEKGDVVASRKPLDTIFKNKWVEVASNTPLSGGEFVEQDEPLKDLPDAETADAPDAELPSNRREMRDVKKDGMKDEDPDKIKGGPDDGEEDIEDDTDVHENEEVDEDSGKDVTGKYKEATKAGLSVMKYKDKTYAVFNGEEKVEDFGDAMALKKFLAKAPAKKAKK